jgi:8-oxo-dGTP pyrophosphatase MutT (NUDIX family)
MTEKIHRSDIYGDLKNRNEKEASPLIPASTVILLRDGARTDDSSVSQSGEDIEVLMLQKNQNISFGGMWVFPGGRIDDEDYDGEGREAADQMKAALTAAVRETVEETALSVDAEDFVYFAH